MARTRGAKSSSPSSRKRVPREAPVQGPTSEPPRPEAASPPAKPAPQILRRGVISLEPSPAPSSAPSSEPPRSQAPAATFRIPNSIWDSS
ncbi:hypothetical protein CK203_109794 [Vitis vinifera]|uniref:Uncharacterized protein n=1 Tax=Vitis vinifera TaxID=29760 RepID=A0A438FE04_VITVI|nr:hypothetical protein CK203_109794 [Vitis vinifera]